MSMILRRFLPFALLTFGAWGCSNKPADAAASPDEDAVRKAFASLQDAIKSKNAEQLWGLLDDETRAEADRAAKETRGVYTKADAAGKAEQEKSFGLTASEMAGLDGKAFLRSNRFHGKYHEVPASKVEKIVVQGDKATVTYVEDDDDHDREKLNFVKQGGQWKASLPMPRGG
ncbi:MAG: hypothetical protein U0791_06865 [Gemmataceae bacterium]